MHEWKSAKLKDLADIRPSNVDKVSIEGELPVQLCNYMDAYSNEYIRSDLPFMEATATPSEIRRFTVAQGDIVLTKDSETPDDIGIAAVTVEAIPNLVCGYHLALIKPNPQLVDPIYLSKYLSLPTTASYFGRQANGSTRYGLSITAIENTPIAYPQVTLQKAASNILRVIDDTIDSTSALISKYQNIKAGLMQSLFSRGVTPDGKLRPPREEEPEHYWKSPIGWIPKEWSAEKLGDILKRHGGYLQTGPFGSQLHADEYQYEGVPVIMPQDINEGAVRTDNIAKIHLRRAEDLSKHRMKIGDVVIARRGDLSRAAAISERERDWICGTGCFLLRLGNYALNPLFAAYAYMQPFIQRQINARAVGTTMASLNNSVMSSLVFPLCRKEEQLEIVSRLRSAEEEISALKKCLRSNTMLKQGLMQDLLSGRVQVNA